MTEIETPEDSMSPAPAKRVAAKTAVDDIDVLYSRLHSRSRKSQTVHLLQDRLAELGFTEAVADRDGFYGELTTRSVSQWQESVKHPATGELTSAEFETVFKGAKGIRAVVDISE